jgi:hypothetical protein
LRVTIRSNKKGLEIQAHVLQSSAGVGSRQGWGRFRRSGAGVAVRRLVPASCATRTAVQSRNQPSNTERANRLAGPHVTRRVRTRRGRKQGAFTAPTTHDASIPTAAPSEPREAPTGPCEPPWPPAPAGTARDRGTGLTCRIYAAHTPRCELWRHIAAYNTSGAL